jgi:NAD(P)-dependent dehydrogenase (short-subunit alcohol dehydrogenase family)
MTDTFSGKVCLVTGAGSGIGAASAALIAERGAKVAVVGLPDDPLADTVELIESAGGSAAAFAADVADATQMRAAVAQAVKTLGPLSLAVNAAGVTGAHTLIHDDPDDDWEHVIGVNLSGVYASMRAEISAMLAAGGGSIVNIASVHTVHTLSHRSAYTASKHGVLGLTRNAALDYSGLNIRINAVSPGITDTPMMRSGGAQSAAILAKVPMARLAQPVEIAQGIAFLLSDEAAYVTGSELVVDGGQLLV